MENKILIEVSARHVHLTQEHLEILFGAGAELTFKKALSQPGQFVCEERVTIVGPKREIANVVIIGPIRPATQVEISMTDGFNIGVTPPIRESGDVNGSAACKIVGPKGELQLSEGVIVAKRHIHLTPETAAQFNVEDKQIVGVKIVNDKRSTVYGDVIVRISAKFAPAMHIDTDEANAACVTGEVYGKINVESGSVQ